MEKHMISRQNNKLLTSHSSIYDYLREWGKAKKALTLGVRLVQDGEYQ